MADSPIEPDAAPSFLRELVYIAVLDLNHSKG